MNKFDERILLCNLAQRYLDVIVQIDGPKVSECFHMDGRKTYTAYFSKLTELSLELSPAVRGFNGETLQTSKYLPILNSWEPIDAFDLHILTIFRDMDDDKYNAKLKWAAHCWVMKNTEIEK